MRHFLQGINFSVTATTRLETAERIATSCCLEDRGMAAATQYPIKTGVRPVVVLANHFIRRYLLMALDGTRKMGDHRVYGSTRQGYYPSIARGAASFRLNCSSSSTGTIHR